MEMSSTTPYETLEIGDDLSDRIRLLHLSPGAFEDPLHISLTAHSITELPEYSALSYAWGTDISDRLATVDNFSLSISKNLDVALRYLRHAEDPRTLWIDAICINQISINERNHQVQLMGSIYSKASRVIVWLGPSTHNSDFLMDHIVNGEDIDDSEVPRFILAAAQTIQRPWFSRMWVVQEIVLASKDPLILCGNRSTSLGNFFRFLRAQTERAKTPEPTNVSDTEAKLPIRGDFASWLNIVVALPTYYRDYSPMKAEFDRTGEDNIFMTKAVTAAARNVCGAVATRLQQLYILQGFRKQRKYLDLSGLLYVTMERHCKDPRDKIYSLIGMLSLSMRSSYQIFPDYSRPVGVIFAEAMHAIIKERFSWSYSVFPLKRAKESRIDNLPSWVPDFSVAYDVQGLEQLFDSGLAPKTLSILSRYKLWIPSPSADEIEEVLKKTNCPLPLASFSADYKVLHTSGIRLGTVAELIPIKGTANWDNFTRRRQLSHLIMQLHPITIRLRMPIEEVLSVFLGPRVGPDFSSQVPEHLRSDELVDYLVQEFDNMSYYIGIMRMDRVLFLTHAGKLGMTIGDTEVGDILAGLFGINFPFLLRKSPGGYEMVNVGHLEGHRLGHGLRPNDGEDESDGFAINELEQFAIY